MRIELLQTLKSGKTIYMKGIIFDEAHTKIPSEIKLEAELGSPTVRVLPDLTHPTDEEPSLSGEGSSSNETSSSEETKKPKKPKKTSKSKNPEEPESNSEKPKLLRK